MAGRRFPGRRGPAACVATLVVLAVAGCGSDEGEEVSVPDPPKPVLDLGPAGELTPLVGKYRYDAGATEGQVASGPWRLVLGAGRFGLIAPTEAIQVGRYSVSGQTAVFVNKECGRVRGRYRWTRSEGLLTFEPLGDTCANRVAALTALPWHERAPGAPDDRSTRAEGPDSLTDGTFGFTAGPEDTALAAGNWKLELKGGKYALILPDDTGFPGTIEFSGDEARFVGRPCEAEVGRYRWRLEGNVLTFRTIQDDCVDRAAMLTAKPWDGGAA
jgi:hypothetical protein